MKLKVLVDNNTYIDQYYCGEPAVSYYIEDEDTSFLFDVGYSDLFIRNSNSLGIDLQNISSIVISHGHDDHTGGLKYYFGQNHKNNISIMLIQTHLMKNHRRFKNLLSYLKHELKEKCNLILSKDQ
ncbi:MBL fold metallo-hydrolase [Clostridium botulinum]|nr:MBL fold metallo-hydrolase [Clostridium botulinum]